MFTETENEVGFMPALKPFLKGKTIIITGASRGIGRKIALRAAQDGANVVIVAKTTDPNPKLPGTIFSVAAEVQKAGGQALAIPCDIRKDDQIQNVINKTIERFGGIDILINNASAIQLSDTVSLDMKRYDLMHQINVRGTFAMSKACIPHLARSSNPHILNMSPPLSMKAHWFEGHVAYTMSKYGMSMVALGLSAELADKGIAVNALWPRTIIFTAALQQIDRSAVELMRKQSRIPEIIADAAYTIINQPSRQFTGNFCLDDQILAHQGLTNLDRYAATPGSKEFAPDGYIEPDHHTEKTPKQILQINGSKY